MRLRERLRKLARNLEYVATGISSILSLTPRYRTEIEALIEDSEKIGIDLRRVIREYGNCIPRRRS